MSTLARITLGRLIPAGSGGISFVGGFVAGEVRASVAGTVQGSTIAGTVDAPRIAGSVRASFTGEVGGRIMGEVNAPRISGEVG